MRSFNKILEEYVILLESENSNLRDQVLYWKSKKVKTTGVLYVLQQEGTTHYKIGISQSYQNRLKTFGVQLPFNMIEIATYETTMIRECEQAVHKEFASYRLNGSEFFNLTEDKLSLIPKIIERVEQGDIKEEVVKTLQDNQDDQLLDKARKLMESGHEITSSFLQRKLRIGYSRAARIKDALLQSPSDGIDTIKK